MTARRVLSGILPLLSACDDDDQCLEATEQSRIVLDETLAVLNACEGSGDVETGVREAACDDYCASAASLRAAASGLNSNCNNGRLEDDLQDIANDLDDLADAAEGSSVCQ